MAVDFMGSSSSSSGYRNISATLEENAVQEAASGLESVEKLIRLLSQTSSLHKLDNNKYNSSSSSLSSMDMDCTAVTDAAVSKFKKVISLLGRTRTGHARFRRAPLGCTNALIPKTQHESSSTSIYVKQLPLELSTSSTRVYHATPIQQIHPPPIIPQPNIKDSSTTINFSSYNNNNSSAATTSFMSSLTGDSDSKQLMSSSSAFQITNMSSQVSSAGKPPLSSLKRKCSSDTLGSGNCGATSSSGRCHCSKKRKLRVKRVVRVPAISLKMADIPPDDYSWRKYGQKPIKGSPHPRGYYKCSSVRGCPARKHVERALDDPAMLIVTYEAEHNHSLNVAEASNIILESS